MNFVYLVCSYLSMDAKLPPSTATHSNVSQSMGDKLPPSTATATHSISQSMNDKLPPSAATITATRSNVSQSMGDKLPLSAATASADRSVSQFMDDKLLPAAAVTTAHSSVSHDTDVQVGSRSSSSHAGRRVNIVFVFWITFAFVVVFSHMQKTLQSCL